MLVFAQGKDKAKASAMGASKETDGVENDGTAKKKDGAETKKRDGVETKTKDAAKDGDKDKKGDKSAETTFQFDVRCFAALFVVFLLFLFDTV